MAGARTLWGGESSTWDRFSAAEELNDLYESGVDGLYVTLKESGFFPEREYLIRDDRDDYVADLVVPCKGGLVKVVCGDGPAAPDALLNPDPEAVRQAVARLGGPLSPKARS